MNTAALQALHLVFRVDAALERYEDDGIANCADRRGRAMQPRLHRALVGAEKRYYRRVKMPEVAMATVRVGFESYQIQWDRAKDVLREQKLGRAKFGSFG